MKTVVIVSPALADANNGNWQTARRWQNLLGKPYSARIVSAWPDADANVERDEVMLALHARRSAASVRAWASARGPHGLAVVLTGTDLYRDIATDAQAQQSLVLAQRLVVLQAQGLQALPEGLRAKAQVMFQSTSARQTLPKSTRHLRVVMVGHLREEKDPLTLMAAARLLQSMPCTVDIHDLHSIHIDHIGAPLDAALGHAAQTTARECPNYRWLGEQTHEATRRRIQRAHVLIHASRMEGGAHVVMEAVRCGTPVLASNIPGNVGMLGADYAGYFEVGDAAGLAGLLCQCHAELTATQTLRSNALLTLLQAQCAARAPLFSPVTEQAALRRLVAQLSP